ncbi:MAG TPA: hypothetical protein VEV38_11730 [Candidatus Eremiobacteraceae bacterium]|nr:hypothetical protein [Candidatus Eremiobacteraceae bacterium]
MSAIALATSPLGVAAPTPSPSVSPTPTPTATAVASASPAATASPSATPTPSANPTSLPVIASGQIVDLERGYIVLATGDAFKLDPAVRIIDDKTGAAPSYAIVPGVFGSITIDQATALVTDVRTSLEPLAEGIQVAQIPRALVSVASSPQPNPDLAPPPVMLRSQLSSAVRVTIDVEVPPETPLTDDIYITTDSSGWNAQAIKMQKVDGRHFRIQVDLKGGTQFRYLFTRGSWQSVERARSGLARDPRTLFVPGGDSMVLDATVYRWADIQ